MPFPWTETLERSDRAPELAQCALGEVYSIRRIDSGVWIGVVACALIGVGILIYTVYQRRRMEASDNWPRVTGKITRTGVEVVNDGESNNFVASVLYNYVVGGRTYTGRRIGFSRRQYVRRKRAEEEADKYPVGATVDVYFDPKEPWDGVLTREYPDNIPLTICGIGLLILAVAIPLFSR
jgi:hypothetical protein